MFKFDNIETKYKVVKRKVTVMIAGIAVAATAVASDLKTPDYAFQDISPAAIVKLHHATPYSVSLSLPRSSSLPEIFFSVLDDLYSCCHDDWDGEGALAVKEATINNCREILSVAISFNHLLTSVYATELGTVCLQWHNFDNDNLINVEVSPRRMAFYFDNPSSGLSEFPSTEFNANSLRKFSTVISQI